jgi:hypothetical protein
METILLQVLDANIGSWLIEQAGLVVVMGVVIWWLAKRYEKVEDEKGELAKEVIKLMVNVENKMDGDKNENGEIKAMLHKIIDLVQKWEK